MTTPLAPLETTTTAGTVRRTYPIVTPDPKSAESRFAADIITKPPPPAPRNDLGANFHQTGETVAPPLPNFVELHLAELASDDEIEALRLAHDEVVKEFKLQDDHSGPVLAQQEAKALEAYSHDPSEANLKRLRECKTLELKDHAMIHQISRQRQATIIRERVDGPAKVILQRASQICTDHAAHLAATDASAYESVGLKPQSHPLVGGLQKMARGFEVQTLAKVPMSQFPELLTEILKADAARTAALAQGAKK